MGLRSANSAASRYVRVKPCSGNSRKPRPSKEIPQQYVSVQRRHLVEATVAETTRYRRCDPWWSAGSENLGRPNVRPQFISLGQQAYDCREGRTGQAHLSLAIRGLSEEAWLITQTKRPNRGVSSFRSPANLTGSA